MAKATGKNINYTLTVPKQGPSTSSGTEGLLTQFVSTMSHYYEMAEYAQGRQRHGTDVPSLYGNSAKPNERPNGASAGQKNGSGGNSSGTSTAADGSAARNAIASSIRAINTRRGKFGSTTKLKPTTERSLTAKGFAVGKPPELPRRTGQNRPKGQGGY